MYSAQIDIVEALSVLHQYRQFNLPALVVLGKEEQIMGRSGKWGMQTLVICIPGIFHLLQPLDEVFAECITLAAVTLSSDYILSTTVTILATMLMS